MSATSWLVGGADFVVDDIFGGPNLDPDDMTAAEKMKAMEHLRSKDARENSTDDTFLIDVLDVGLTWQDDDASFGDVTAEIADAGGVAETPAARAAVSEEVDETTSALLAAIEDIINEVVGPMIRSVSEGIVSALIKIGEIVGFMIMSQVDQQFRREYGDPLVLTGVKLVTTEIFTWELFEHYDINRFGYTLHYNDADNEWIHEAGFKSVQTGFGVTSTEDGSYMTSNRSTEEVTDNFGVLFPPHPMDPLKLINAPLQDWIPTIQRLQMSHNFVTTIRLLPMFDKIRSAQSGVTKNLLWEGRPWVGCPAKRQHFTDGIQPAPRIQHGYQGGQQGYQSSPPSGLPSAWKANIWEESWIYGGDVENGVFFYLYKNVFVSLNNKRRDLIDAQPGNEPAGFPLDVGQEYWQMVSEKNFTLEAGVIYHVEY